MVRTSKKKAFLVLVSIISALLIASVYTFTQTDGINEAAVRHLVQRLPSVVFLSFDGNDPHARFNARISDLQGVRKKSQSVSMPDPSSRIGTSLTDKLTGLKGEPLNLSRLSWKGPFKVEIHASYSRAASKLILQRDVLGWHVVGEKDRWEE
jgi:hypothetical protein